MHISAKVLADSLAPCGARLTTMEWTYPRCIHSEIMTHRMLSKNSASSRAIPVEKMLARIQEAPFVPKVWGTNKPGMQAGDALEGPNRALAIGKWHSARECAVQHAEALHGMGLHKQIVNRLVEPWMWITIIVSATDWDNVWGLRCHEAAEPHFQELAYKSRDAMAASTPTFLKAGEWHLPLIHPEDWETAATVLQIPSGDEHLEGNHRDMMALLKKVSVGRCARVSYLTHDGKRDIQADIDLHDRLVVQKPAHATPAEHVAQALDWPEWFRTVMKKVVREQPMLVEEAQRIVEAAGHDAPTFHPDGDVLNDLTAYGLRNQVVSRRRDRRDAPPTPQDLLFETTLGQLTSGNFLGFQQYRKTLQQEHIGGLMP